MGVRKHQETLQQTDIPIAASEELTAFLRLPTRIIFCSTTRHKADRALAFFQRLGVQSEQIDYYSASAEPINWHEPEEIAKAKVVQVARETNYHGRFIFVGTDVVVALNGDTIPGGKLHGTEEDTKRILMETIGPNKTGLREAEIQVGIAAYNLNNGKSRGVYSRIHYPFVFDPFTEDEIHEYYRKEKQRISRRSGGLDFAGSMAGHITWICGIPRVITFSESNTSVLNPEFDLVFQDFQNAAFGFPEKEVTGLLEDLAVRRKGIQRWNESFVNR